ncbi:MAG: hypothetical protein PHD04_02850, partial [Candidatus Pacebacteria bacterium]|nr:hypothetical protein [Candidatus Paceibacterota bacterium]
MPESLMSSGMPSSFLSEDATTPIEAKPYASPPPSVGNLSDIGKVVPKIEDYQQPDIPKQDIVDKDTFLSSFPPEEQAKRSKEYDTIANAKKSAENESGLLNRSMWSLTTGMNPLIKWPVGTITYMAGDKEKAKKVWNAVDPREAAGVFEYKAQNIPEHLADILPRTAATIGEIALVSKGLGFVVPAAQKLMYAKTISNLATKSGVAAKVVDNFARMFTAFIAVDQANLPSAATLKERLKATGKSTAMTGGFALAGNVGSLLAKAPVLNLVPFIEKTSPWFVQGGIGWAFESKNGTDPTAGWIGALTFIGLHALNYGPRKYAIDRVKEPLKAMGMSNAEATSVAVDVVDRAETIKSASARLPDKEKAQLELTYGRTARPVNAQWEDVLPNKAKVSKEVQENYAKAQQEGIVTAVVDLAMEGRTIDDITGKIVARRKGLLFANAKAMVEAVREMKQTPALDNPQELLTWVSENKRNHRQKALDAAQEAAKK